MDIILSAEQKALLEVMEQTHQHLFITGRAGTGKSVLLRHFRENTTKKVVIAAPTGIAALNVKGQTLHSLFKLPPQLHRKGSLQPNPRACMLLKRIDTLVIDEISMVRADLLDAVDERLREATKKDMPFGGVQVIMFGDVYQLPPVVEEGLMPYFEAVHGGYFFFNALAWRASEFKIYELTQVFRQKDPVFKDILNAVRDGSVSDSQIEALNARHAMVIPAEGTVTLAPTNNLVTTINQQRLDQLEGKAYEYKAIVTGEMKRSTFPTEEVIQLKVGAQVVLLQNDKDKRWVNGTVATIAALKKDDKEEKITVHVEGIDYELEVTTWEEIRYEYDHAQGKVKEEVVSSFTQYPIRLAWAMTIHKSQGQTYESVALDLTTATFAPGQLYVALSRCISLEGLYLKMPVQRKHIIVEPKVTAFMARREAIVIVEAEEAQPTLFDIDAALDHAINVMTEAIAEEVPPVRSADEVFALIDQVREETKEAPTPRKRGRTPGQSEPTKKKDFRFPVRLLEALKQVADEDGMSDTELVMSLIKSDKRIQRKLFEDKHEQADFYVEEEASIQVGDRVQINRSGTILRGTVKRIDTKGVASGADCYLVHLDGDLLMSYFCGNEVQRACAMTEEMER